MLAAFVLPVQLAYQYLDPDYLKVFRDVPLAAFGELALDIAAVVLALLTTILLFRKSPLFPRMFILACVAGVAIPVAQAVWIAFAFSQTLGRPFSELLEFDAQEIGRLILAAIGAAIWITYTLKSKRVRNTFILGLSARDLIVEDEGARRLETPLLLAIGAVIFMLGMSSVVLGVWLTSIRGAFNGSIIGGALQAGLALWLLRGSDIARLILALLFGIATVGTGWLVFLPNQGPSTKIALLPLVLLFAVIFWFRAFSKRLRAQLEINEAKYAKPDSETAGES